MTKVYCNAVKHSGCNTSSSLISTVGDSKCYLHRVKRLVWGDLRSFWWHILLLVIVALLTHSDSPQCLSSFEPYDHVPVIEQIPCITCSCWNCFSAVFIFDIFCAMSSSLKLKCVQTSDMVFFFGTRCTSRPCLQFLLLVKAYYVLPM